MEAVQTEKLAPITPYRIDEEGRFSMLRVQRRLFCVCGYQIGTGGTHGAWLFRSVAVLIYKNQFRVRCNKCKGITTITVDRKALVNV